MKCTNCGFEFEGKFCPECGRKAQEVCPECGNARLEGVKFCAECGHAFEVKATKSAKKSTKTVEEKARTGQNASEAPGASGAEEQPPVVTGANVAADSPSVETFNAQPSRAKEKFDLKGKVAAIVEKSRANGVADKLARWLPACLSLLFGFLILAFMACPAYKLSLGGFEDVFSELGAPSAAVSVYGIMGAKAGGASFGAVMLLLLGLGFLICGGIKMYAAVKFPYYTNTGLNIAQDVMLFFTFVFSCVVVGACNTQTSKAGAGGALVLSFSLLGALIYIGALYLIKKGFGVELSQKRAQGKVAFDGAIEGYKAKKAERAQKLAEIEEIKMQAMKDAAAVPPQTILASPLYGESAVCDRKIKHYRWVPAVWTLTLGFLVLLWLALPLFDGSSKLLAQNVFATVIGKAADEFTSMWVLMVATMGAAFIPGIVLMIAGVGLFACGLARFVKAYTDPYEKHPLITYFQLFFTHLTLVSSIVFIVYYFLIA